MHLCLEFSVLYKVLKLFFQYCCFKASNCMLLSDSGDDSLWDDSDDRVNNSSDLDREWQRRRDQFHTVF